MTHNRQDLRTLIRRRLGDLASPYHFSDDQLNQWLNDAIADYSVHFPRLEMQTILVAAEDEGSHHFPLDPAVRAVLSVEYPAGMQPPVFLRPHDRLLVGFYHSPAHYDLALTGSQDQPPELWLSAEVLEGEALSVRYQSSHRYLDSDDDLCSLPEQHFELLALFCRWAAYQELASAESADPDPAGGNLERLEGNAALAEAAYRAQLEAYLRAESANRVVVWEMEGGRVY